MPFMELPSGLDVYSILLAALQNPEYRDKLLFVVGFLWGFGFVCGILLMAVFSNPKHDMERVKTKK